jgi:hypothetical protein
MTVSRSETLCPVHGSEVKVKVFLVQVPVISDCHKFSGKMLQIVFYRKQKSSECVSRNTQRAEGYIDFSLLSSFEKNKYMLFTSPCRLSVCLSVYLCIPPSH